MAGPLIVSQMLIWNGQQASTLGMVGVFLILFGIIFFAFYKLDMLRKSHAVGGQ